MTSGGDGHDKSGDLLGSDSKSNVISFKVPRKASGQASKKAPQKKLKQKATSMSKWNKSEQPTDPPPLAALPTEPLINVPPYTKYLLGLLVAIHLIITFALSEEQAYWVYTHLGFIPGRFTGSAFFEPLALITPLTHLFLHGSWLHIAMNSVMLLAFGSGIEKWIGGKKMLVIFFVCGLCGMLAHLALNFNSVQPIIGASGGLSGLFAAALIMLNRQHNMVKGKYGFWPLIGLWVGISIIFGFIGSPDGGEIAWAAHVGGFLGGFALVKWMKI